MFSTLRHGADTCPYKREANISPKHVNALEGYQPRPGYNPNANTYNPRWGTHLDFSKCQNNSAFAQSSNP